MPLIKRFQNAWNAFNANTNEKQSSNPTWFNYSGAERPDKPYLTGSNERSIIAPIYNRIALDAASTTIVHAKLDGNKRFKEIIDDELNSCLNFEANLDQGSKAFWMDFYLSLFDEGNACIAPIITDVNANDNDSKKIYSIRTARVTEWMPSMVEVEAYNEVSGKREPLVFDKRVIPIVENPFFAVMNEQTSVVKRLLDKMRMLDKMDEHSSSGRLDLIVQLPFSLRTDLKRQQAEDRRRDIENQLVNSKYGIGYIDQSEHVTQLNRPVNNQLLEQIKDLRDDLYTQLGITPAILNGTASPEEMANYYSRVIDPLLATVTEEMARKFLTKTARTQGQSIVYYRDPFRLVPPEKMAEIADKYTRNEIVSSNEVRQSIGLRPSDDASADELRNKNISQSSDQRIAMAPVSDDEY